MVKPSDDGVFSQQRFVVCSEGLYNMNIHLILELGLS